MGSNEHRGYPSVSLLEALTTTICPPPKVRGGDYHRWGFPQSPSTHLEHNVLTKAKPQPTNQDATNTQPNL